MRKSRNRSGWSNTASLTELMTALPMTVDVHYKLNQDKIMLRREMENLRDQKNFLQQQVQF